MTIASISKRLFAGFIDVAVFMTLFFIVLTEFKNGQSIGKRLTKIKVVRQGSGDTTFLHTFLRHLFNLVDLTLLIGLVVGLTNKARQRIGDLVAKTKVVTK